MGYDHPVIVAHSDNAVSGTAKETKAPDPAGWFVVQSSRNFMNTKVGRCHCGVTIMKMGRILWRAAALVFLEAFSVGIESPTARAQSSDGLNTLNQQAFQLSAS
jgi:hypothetical protein